MAQTRGWSRDEKDDRANTLATLIQKAWRAVMRALVGDSTSMVSMSDLNELPSLWAQQVDGPLLGYLGTQVLDGAERVRQDVSLGPTALLVTEDFIEEHLLQAANRFRYLSEDVWDAVRAQLLIGYAADEDIKQLAARIKHVGNVSDKKALTIARTEIHAALEAGSFAQAAMVDPDGKKSWLATNDSRTRPTHEEADGQTRKIDEPFMVGRSYLQYPGDPRGPLDETIMCRCSVTYELFPDVTMEDEEELALMSAGYPWAKKNSNWDPGDHPRDPHNGQFVDDVLSDIEIQNLLKGYKDKGGGVYSKGGGIPKQKKAPPTPEQIAAAKAAEARRIQRKYGGRTPEEIAELAKDPKKFVILPKAMRGKSGDSYLVKNQQWRIWGKYGSSGVMIKAPNEDGEDSFLFIQRGKAVSNTGKWQLPGGASDQYETPAQGAARETYEELHVSQKYMDGVRHLGTHETVQPIEGQPTPWKYTNIAAEADEQFEPSVDNAEVMNALWLTRPQIAMMIRDGDFHPALADSLSKIFDIFDTGESTTELKEIIPADPPKPAKAQSYKFVSEMALTASVTRKWEPEQHPRGKDGKFIRKGALASFFQMKSPTFNQLKEAVEAVDSQDTWDNLTDKQKGWISKLTHGISESPSSKPLKHKISGLESPADDMDVISTPVPAKTDPEVAQNKQLDSPPSIPSPVPAPIKNVEPSKATVPAKTTTTAGHKKFVPATIHKPHQDGTVVAISADGVSRLRWDAVSKTYLHQKKYDGAPNWMTYKSMTKAAAYTLAKESYWDWRQPKTVEIKAPTTPISYIPAASVAQTELKPLPSIHAPGSIAAVMNAAKPDPSKMKKIGNAATGVSASPIYMDDKGQRWLVRRKKSPQDDPVLEIDVAANKLQVALGLKGPKTYVMDVDGQPGAVQAMFDAQDAFPQGSFKPTTLSASDVRDMQMEQVLDWLLGNNDAHSGQFIRLPNGHISSIDKGHAFRFYAKDKLSPDYKPWSPLPPNKHTYPDMWKAYANGEAIEMHNPNKDPEISQTIQKAQELSNDDIRDMFGGYALGAAKNGWLGTYGNDPEIFMQAIMKRRDNLHADFSKLYNDTTKQREEKLAKTTPVVKMAYPVAVDSDNIALADKIMQVGANVDTGKQIMSGDLQGTQVYLQKGGALSSYSVFDENDNFIQTVSGQLGLEKLLNDPDYKWTPDTLIAPSTSSNLVQQLVDLQVPAGTPLLQGELNNGDIVHLSKGKMPHLFEVLDADSGELISVVNASSLSLLLEEDTDYTWNTKILATPSAPVSPRPSMTLDVSFGDDEEVEDALNNLVQDTNVSYTIIDDMGPGGWPSVKFTGSKDDLTKVLNKYDDSGEFDIDDVLDDPPPSSDLDSRQQAAFDLIQDKMQSGMKYGTLLVGEDMDGGTVWLTIGDETHPYKLINAFGKTYVDFTSNDHLKTWLANGTVKWKLPEKIESDTWWEPDDELSVDDINDALFHTGVGSTIGVTTDGSLVLLYNPKTGQLEIHKQVPGSDQWQLVSKLGLPNEADAVGEWEDDFGDVTAYHSNEGVKSWLKGEIGVPHFGVPKNVPQHNAGDATATEAASNSAWHQKLTPELVATFIPNQIVATVTTDLGEFRILSGGTTVVPASGKIDATKFRIQRKNAGAWMTLETNVSLSELAFSATDHSGTSKWNIVDFDPVKPPASMGNDISSLSPAQIGVIKTYFSANGAKWHNKPEAIWDALQSFKTSDAGVGFEGLNDLQILAALDASTMVKDKPDAYQTKMKKWLGSSKGLDYVSKNTTVVSNPTPTPSTPAEHPGVKLIMQAYNHPNTTVNTVLADMNRSDGKHIVLTKGQFDDNVIISVDGLATGTLKPSQVNYYVSLNDDLGTWKFYPTPGGSPVSGKGVDTPGFTLNPVVTSWADMDKWAWQPGDIVAVRDDNKWRITYTDESKFNIEVNVGTPENPVWGNNGIVGPQSSLLGHFPLDVDGMTATWYTGTPTGDVPTTKATGSDIWNATSAFGPKTLEKLIATGTDPNGNVYKIKQSGDGEGFKAMSLYAVSSSGNDVQLGAYNFDTEAKMDYFIQDSVLGSNIDWTITPPSTEGEVQDVSFASDLAKVSIGVPVTDLPDGTQVTLSAEHINPTGWQQILDEKSTDGSVKLHAMTTDHQYQLTSSHGWFYVKKLSPHGTYELESSGKQPYLTATNGAGSFSDWVHADKIAPAHTSKDKFTGLLGTSNSVLPDGTPISKGYTIPADGWESIGTPGDSSTLKLHAVVTSGDVILVSKTDNGHTFYQLRKYDPSTGKYAFFAGPSPYAKKLAQDHSDYWHYAVDMSEPGVVKTSPPTPVGNPNMIKLPDGTEVDKGPVIKVWKNLADNKYGGKVIAYTADGQFRIKASYGSFTLEKWNPTTNKYSFIDNEQYKLASMAKIVPNATWHDATMVPPPTKVTPPAPPAPPPPPPPPADPVGVHGTLTLPSGKKVAKGPWINTWGPHAKKSQYTKSTVIAYSGQGSHRLIYSKQDSNFKFQSYDKDTAKWETKASDPYKLATVAKSQGNYTWYQPKEKPGSPGTVTPGAVPNAGTSAKVTVPGGGTIDLGTGDITHISETERQKIYKEFKAQPATYLSSPSQDIWAALLTMSDNHGLTKMQVLRVIDDVGAKKVSKPDEHKFEQKIKDWLQTPAGYAILHNLPIPKPPPPKFSNDVDGKIMPLDQSNKLSYPVKSVGETSAWFEKAVKAHGTPPTGTAKSGVTAYTGGIYHSINAYLYGGVQTISSSNETHMRNAQAAMIPSVEPIMLHRGVGYGAFKAKSFEQLKKMEGQVRWMGGFGSTSVGGHSAFSGQVKIEIEAPPGTPMYWAKPISLHKGENEMLLAAGLHYHIISVTQNYGSGATVRVRIVPKPADESQIIAAAEMRW